LPHELLLDVAKEHHHIKFEQAGPHGTFLSVYNKRLSDFPKCRYHQHNEDHLRVQIRRWPERSVAASLVGSQPRVSKGEEYTGDEWEVT